MDANFYASVITSFYSKVDNAEEHEILLQWPENPEFVQHVHQIISQSSNYQDKVVIFTLFQYQNYYISVKNEISEEESVATAEILNAFLKEKVVNSYIYNIACSVLIDIAIKTSLPFFKLPDFMTNNFPEEYYLEFLIIYLQRFHILSSKINRDAQDEIRSDILNICLPLLAERDVSYSWLRVWDLVLEHTNGFQDMIWIIEKMEAAVEIPDAIPIIVDIISLCFSYSNEVDAEYYFRLYQFFLELSQYLRTEPHEDYDQLMLVWGEVINSQTNFIDKEDFGEILKALLEELSQVIECVPIDNDLWPSFIFKLDRFLQVFTEDVNKEVILIIFEQTLRLLDRELPPFKETDHLLEEFWDNNSRYPEVQQEIQENIIQLLSKMLEEQHVGAYSVIAHLWGSFNENVASFSKAELGDVACNKLKEYVEAAGAVPGTALVFIKKVGVNFPQYHSFFFNMIASCCYETEDYYPRAVVRTLVAHDCQEEFEVGGELLQFLSQNIGDTFKNKSPYDIASTILLLGLYEDSSVGSDVYTVIMQGIQTGIEEARSSGLYKIEEPLILITKILKLVSKVLRTEFIVSLFSQIYIDARGILEEVLLENNENIQEIHVNLTLIISKFIDISEQVNEWFGAIIENGIFKTCHYNLVPLICGTYSMEPFTEMISSISLEENQEEVKSLAMMMKEIDQLWDFVPKELVHAIFSTSEPDTLLYISQAVDKRIDALLEALASNAEGVDPEIDLFKAIADSISKGLGNTYPELRNDKVIGTLIKITKLIGGDDMREILAQKFSEELIEHIIMKSVE